jgi:hypothetical protein
MNKSQILSERPFELSDGDWYFIIINRNNVFTRKFDGKPIIIGDFKHAKVYKDFNLVQKAAVELFSTNEYHQKSEIGIARVKDNFEPRYVVKYDIGDLLKQPKITYHVEWFKLGEYDECTYADYNEAHKQLQKYKHDLVEYHYGEIMKIRNMELKKI